MTTVPTADDTGVIAVVNHLLAEAWRQRASDIHVEPRTDRLRIRYRIDGILSERPPVAAGMATAVLNRFKVLGSLDIAEKRLPQDGSFRHTLDDTDFPVRISSFPTPYGEKLVLRLLGERREVTPLGELGMPSGMVEALRRMARRPNGMLLVAGPTGSGKTSTLYSVIRDIERQEINIVTLEDPIEYRFAGVTQGQTSARAGFTFAAGLRSILRQDPDVIMVGEIRDAETAEIALRAALTGHLVLSSLHTSSVAETVVRLVDMGVEPFVVASALRGVVSQRLVRRLCLACRKGVPVDAAMRETMALRVPPLQVYEPRGCPRCGGTGYTGRCGIFELMEVDETLGVLIKAGAGRPEIDAELRRRGGKPLRDSGMEAVALGVTSLAEVLRVV